MRRWKCRRYKWVAKKLEGEMDTNNDRVDGVLEELMGEGGQGGRRVPQF